MVVGQCRPLSKTVRFNVLKVQKGKEERNNFRNIELECINRRALLCVIEIFMKN